MVLAYQLMYRNAYERKVFSCIVYCVDPRRVWFYRHLPIPDIYHQDEILVHVPNYRGRSVQPNTGPRLHPKSKIGE